MCGICGFSTTAAENNQQTIQRMIETLKHRGPDHQGIFTHGQIALANARLSIIDLQSGNQPVFDETKSCCIVFNGEMYNYQELRKLLEQKGVKFQTKSDTEAILQAYKIYGFDCVKYFNGMWAFTIFDAAKKILFLSRDRFGKKPLYYLFDGEKFIFGSEIKAIKKYPNVKTTLSEKALMYYLTYGYIPQPHAIYKEVKKLPAGHHLVIEMNEHGGKLSEKIWQYYDPSDALKEKMCNVSEQEIEENIRKHLERSTEMRLVADVPVGAFLSGGIDSSAVVAAIRKSRPETELHTFSIGFADKKYDETPYAEIAAKLFHTHHHVEMLDEKKMLEILQKLPHFFDEPFADSSMIPTYAVSQLASRYVKVALSGDGGDELFGGYGNFVFFRFVDLVGKIYPSWLSKIASPFVQFLRNRLFPFQKKGKINLVLSELAPLASKKWERFSRISSLGVVKKAQHHELFRPYFQFPHWLDNLTNVYLHTHLVDDFLVKVDRASMANSLEIRCPFLDYEFAEYALKIPAKMKIRESVKGWEKKYILKKALKGFLPDEILYRRKHGFSIPMNEFFAAKKAWMKEKISRLVKRDIMPFQRDFFDDLLDEYEKGHRDLGQFLYALVFLELWCEEWL